MKISNFQLTSFTFFTDSDTRTGAAILSGKTDKICNLKREQFCKTQFLQIQNFTFNIK